MRQLDNEIEDNYVFCCISMPFIEENMPLPLKSFKCVGYCCFDLFLLNIFVLISF